MESKLNYEIASSVSSTLSSLEEYKEKVKITAENLILNKFPERILELQSLLNNEKFHFKNCSLSHSLINIPIHSKKAFNSSEDNIERILSLVIGRVCDSLQNSCESTLFPNGVVECNKNLIELVDVLRPKILQLIKDANSVKMGILLMIPEIEDGNNFGVEIQEQTLCEVAIAELDAQKRLDQFSQYFILRAELVTKVAKYPDCQDYRRCILEMDEKFGLILCLLVVNLRNHYIKLHDIFTKNCNKIKEPRVSNTHLMY